MNIDAFNGTNDSEFLVSFKFSGVSSVADPDDLHIWGGGGGGAPPLDPPLKLNFSTSTSAIL